jgi:hypothetical protein
MHEDSDIAAGADALHGFPDVRQDPLRFVSDDQDVGGVVGLEFVWVFVESPTA